MTYDQDREDQRLTDLLRAVRADADPALWTRVRAQIEARPSVPALLRWAMRPAALAASMALLLATMATALLLAARSSEATGEDYATLAEALLAERDAAATAATSTPEPAGGAAGDSGSGR